jgi:hypothetical protein
MPNGQFADFFNTIKGKPDVRLIARECLQMGPKADIGSGEGDGRFQGESRR